MSLQIIYADRAGSFSVDLGTSAVRLGSISLTTQAQLGEIGSCQLVVDDPTGDAGHSGDQFMGYHSIRIAETDAPADNQIIFDGFSQDRDYHIEDSLITGDAVRISMELSDLNHGTSIRTITEAEGNRPAESVGDRLTWIIGSPYSYFSDNGLVVYPTRMMDAADYRNQTCDNVLSDCAQAVGYNYFVYPDEAASEISLFFDDSNTSSAYTSSLRISNVFTEVDSNVEDGDGATHTWAPLRSLTLKRSPRTLASKVILPYASGTVSVTRAATEDIYGKIDVVAADSNVKSAAVATTRANRVLWESSTEEDVISCSIDLPRANVNDVREGQRLQAKFRQLPGYKSSFAWFRVLQRTVNQRAMTDEFYTVDLELSPQEAAEPVTGIVQSIFGGRCQGCSTESVDVVLPTAVTVGNVLIYVAGRMKSSTGDPEPAYNGVSHVSLGGTGAWTQLGTFVKTGTGDDWTLGAWAKVADGTENQSTNLQGGQGFVGVIETSATTLVGITVVSDNDTGNVVDAGSLGTTTGAVAMMAAGQYTPDGGFMSWVPTDFTTDLAFDHPYFSAVRPWWIGHAITDGTALEAEVSSSVSAKWAAIAVLVP